MTKQKIKSIPSIFHSVYIGFLTISSSAIIRAKYIATRTHPVIYAVVLAVTLTGLGWLSSPNPKYKPSDRVAMVMTGSEFIVLSSFCGVLSDYCSYKVRTHDGFSWSSLKEFEIELVKP